MSMVEDLLDHIEELNAKGFFDNEEAYQYARRNVLDNVDKISEIEGTVDDT